METKRTPTDQTDERRLTHVVSVRFSASELERLKATAEHEGVSVSTLIRRAVLIPRNLGLLTQNNVSAAHGVSVSGDYSVKQGGRTTVRGHNPNLTYQGPAAIQQFAVQR